MKPTYAPPLAILLVPDIPPLSIRQISAELLVEDKQRDLAALELLPRAVRASARAAQMRLCACSPRCEAAKAVCATHMEQLI